MAYSSSHPEDNGYSENGYSGKALNGRANGTPSRREDEITLQEIVGMLWGGKWVILATFVVVVALGAAYTFSVTPIYETSSLVLVENQDNGISSILGQQSSFSPFGQQQNLANEVLVLNQSETITRNVAMRLDTMETNPYTGEPLRVLTGPEGERRTVPEIAGDLVAKGGEATMNASAAGGNVGGRRYETADAISITVKGVSPAEASLISNLYAQAYIERNRQKSQQSAQASRKFLEQQLAKFQEQVNQSEQKLETFMREEKAVALDQETSRIVDQIASMQARRDELEIELDMKQAALNTQEQELAQIRPNLAERLSSGLEEELSSVQKEKAEVETQINAAKRRYPNLDPNGSSQRAREFARLQERARQLEREADSLAKAYVEETIAAGGIQSMPAQSEQGRIQRQNSGLSRVVEMQRQIAQKRIEVSGLKAQLNTVQARLNEYQQELNTLPAQSLELAQLQRERRSTEEIYRFVQEKLQETRMAEESEVGYAEIVRSAGIPVEPVSPNTKLNLVLAAFLGLLGGMGLIFLRQALDTRLRTPEDLQATGSRVIGVVPSMQSLLEAEFDGADEVELDGHTVLSSMVMLTSPMSSVAEAYRRIRANLRFARPDVQIRSLIVSSANKGEGKTTTAANLALAMASAGQKTLIIDADLRNPRLHKAFDKPRSPGLTESLYDETLSTDDNLATDIDHLYVMPAGASAPNPSEILGSQRMRQLVERMEEQFDVVILDTPPLLLFSDPVAVAPHTDGGILVASAGQTDRRAFDQAMSLMEDVGADQIGTILNRFDPEADRYSYGYGYGYGYGSYGYSAQYGEESLRAYYEDDKERSNGFFSFLRR